MAEATKRVGVEFVMKSNSFNNNITTMKKELQLAQTQLNNCAKEVAFYGNNINSLSKQQNILNNSIAFS